MTVQLSSGIIIENSQKILLLHRNKNGITQWELPGGKVEVGESSRQTVVRELQEELGIVARVIRKLGETNFQENSISYTCSLYLIEITSGQARICEPQSFDEVKCFTVKELSSLRLSRNMIRFGDALKKGDLIFDTLV